MSSVINRLIRHVFGTLEAPANIQNKQIKTDIGISDTSDRSRFIVKDSFGTEHRFITQDEIQSLIDSVGGIWIRETNGDAVLYDSIGTTELERITTEGNISHNGAPIPSVGSTISDLRSTANYEFYEDGRVVVTGLGGIWYELTNCFLNGEFTYTYIATGTASKKRHSQDGSTIIYSVESGTGGTEITSFQEICEQDAEGNIAYNQATIPPLLDPNFKHYFYGSGAVRAVNLVDGNTYTGSNFYHREGGGWCFIGTGWATRQEIQKDTGLIIDWISDVSGTANGFMVSVERKRTDADGNISYNRTSLPSVGDTIADITLLGKYEFHEGGRVVFFSTSSGIWLELTNCFPNGAGSFTYINTGEASYTYHSQDGSTIIYSVGSGTAGTAISFFPQAYSQDADGNVSITGLLTLSNYGASVNEFSTDGTLAGNSDDAVPTEKAVKTYIDSNKVWIRETNGDAVLYDATGATELQRITPECNTAYNGASIPSYDALFADADYVFRKNTSVMTLDSGTINTTIGCYRVASGSYLSTTTSDLIVLVLSSSGSYMHYKKASPNVVGTEYPLTTFTATTIA